MVDQAPESSSPLTRIATRTTLTNVELATRLLLYTTHARLFSPESIRVPEERAMTAPGCRSANRAHGPTPLNTDLFHANMGKFLFPSVTVRPWAG